jgi:ABC-type Zn uptake system ZnuABC Zn-binding protein ZnuA
LQQKNNEIQLLETQRDILLRNQRDPELEAQIKRRLQQLIEKLDSI